MKTMQTSYIYSYYYPYSYYYSYSCYYPYSYFYSSPPQAPAGPH